MNYKEGYVFHHKLTNRIFSKFSIKTLIKKYEKRISSPYTRSRVTKQIEKIYTGDIIRAEKVGFSYLDKNKPKVFTEKFTAFLVPIPKTVLRLDDDGNEKRHESSCEFATDDCNCWCKGKYHGIRP